MKLTALGLTHFRNYHKRVFEFDDRVAILGVNATGKTNVLEAIYLLATGESFQAGVIDEMVAWGEEVAHVAGTVVPENPNDKLQISNKSQIQNSNDQEIIELRVGLTRGEVGGKRVRKRQYMVNGVGRQKKNFIGNFLAVVFRPQDLRLMEGSPSRRRELLDQVLSQVDREYRRSLVSYEKGLRRRNKVLSAIRDGKTQANALTFWDQLLVKEGEQLRRKREGLIEFVNSQEALLGERRQMTYDFSAITEERLIKYREREIGAGYTLIGPHKDDFRVISNIKFQMSNNSGRDLSVYGSRGEQRMAVLWLKLSEINFVELKTGERPVLLLDDILSELDTAHEALVMETARKQQTIITSTEKEGRFKQRGFNVIAV